MEIHHIEQQADGGDDSEDNLIPLCFDCHGHVGSYNPNHPKGSKFSPSELRKHKQQWLAICSQTRWSPAKDEPVYALDLHYCEIQSIRWDGTRVAVIIENVGEAVVNVRKVVLRWYDEPHRTNCSWEMTPERQSPLVPRKPMNEHDHPPLWKQEFYLKSYRGDHDDWTMRKLAEANLASLRLEVWADEDEHKPIWLVADEELAMLHFIVRDYVKNKL